MTGKALLEEPVSDQPVQLVEVYDQLSLGYLAFHGLPDLLDGVELRRVRREEYESDLQLLRLLYNVPRMMVRGVVEDHDDRAVAVRIANGFQHLTDAQGSDVF